jgi:hypothetical protein
MYTKEQIDHVHPEYAANIKRWRLYADSYSGGAPYRNGEYLFKYQLETGGEYQNRLDETPLENHCRRTVDSYTSFIYGATIERDYGSIENNPNLLPFLKDADLDGRSYKSFLVQASKNAGIYGSVYVFVDKPASNAGTRAEELGQGIRPYVSLVSPENVIDWKYERQANGYMQLVYLKVLEEKTKDYYAYKIYTPEETMRVISYKENEDIRVIETIPNALGEIPVVVLYNNRTWEHGIGLSDIQDVSDIQRSIYSDYSEINQLIKLSNHPTLVKTNDTEASAGAGSIITIPNEIGDAKPYLLTPSGQNISTLLETIDRKVDAIQTMTHLDSVSGQKTARSGVAMLIEQKALASTLSDKASNLQLAEEQIWRLWCLWEGTAWDGEIYYPDSFDTRDRQQDLLNLKLAQEIGVTDPKLQKYMQVSIASAIVDDSETLQQITESINNETLEHPVTTVENKSSHIQEMIMQGLTDQQILDLHSEISSSDIDTAKQELLNSNNE